MSMNVEMARLLADMRQIRQMAIDKDVLPSNTIGGGAPSLAPEQTQEPEFVKVLGQAINQVNTLQQDASALRTAFEHEQPGVELSQVMVASQKASLATTAVIQVRNKFVKAYEDIMKMPI